MYLRACKFSTLEMAWKAISKLFFGFHGRLYPPWNVDFLDVFMGGTTLSFGKGQFLFNLSKLSGSTIDHAFVKFFWSNIFPTFFDKFGRHLRGVYPWGYTPGLNPCAKERMPNLRGGCPPHGNLSSGGAIRGVPGALPWPPDLLDDG